MAEIDISGELMSTMSKFKKKTKQDFMDGSDWTAELQIQLRYRLLNLTWTLLV